MSASERFEALLHAHRLPLERYIRFHVPPDDWEDVLQEVLLAALKGFDALKSEDAFKPWIIGIARHKCADRLRGKYACRHVPLDEARISITPRRFAPAQDSLVDDTLMRLSPADRQLLLMFYLRRLPQADIARQMGVPLGTIKSRLHAARERFRKAYPVQQTTMRKEESPMKNKMPAYLPPYTIIRRDDVPFPVKWEEMMGFFIVPRLGEELTWAMYDDPDGRRTEVDHLRVTGRALVHGVEGVEIAVQTWDAMDCNQIDGETEVSRTFIAQLTDTHCRALAESHAEGGVKKLFTFLDGSDFLDNWGFGEDNCGNETNLTVKGEIRREGDTVTAIDKPFLMDVVGRYDVTVLGRTYDTICVMDLECYVEGMVTEQYLDREGRTVLWRRFNAEDWRQGATGKTWSELLPDSQRITVNGRTFVHWYDCITDRVV